MPRSVMHPQANEGEGVTFLASFRQARFLKYPDGRVELVGGSEAERNTALQWLTCFLPDVRLGQPQPIPRWANPRAGSWR